MNFGGGENRRDLQSAVRDNRTETDQYLHTAISQRIAPLLKALQLNLVRFADHVIFSHFGGWTQSKTFANMCMNVSGFLCTAVAKL